MTLINDNSNIPSWKKASHILNSNKNITVNDTDHITIENKNETSRTFSF